MADTTAVPGMGTTLKAGDGGGTEVFTAVAEVIRIVPPARKLNTADATHLASPSNYAEKIATFLEAGPASLEIQWNPTQATQEGLVTDMEARTKRNFKICFVDSGAAELAFSGFVTNFELGEITKESKLTATVEITTTGKPVLTP